MFSMISKLFNKSTALWTALCLSLFSSLALAEGTTLGTDAAAQLSASTADIVTYQKSILSVLVLIAIGLVIFSLTRKVH